MLFKSVLISALAAVAVAAPTNNADIKARQPGLLDDLLGNVGGLDAVTGILDNVAGGNLDVGAATSQITDLLDGVLGGVLGGGNAAAGGDAAAGGAAGAAGAADGAAGGANNGLLGGLLGGVLGGGAAKQ